MTARSISLFGEVLFDHFPDGTAVLGGAPFNVAWHLQAFGQKPQFISRVGDDAQGQQVRETMQDWGMGTQALQQDDSRPTGKVNIRFDDGEPDYDIQQDCAYDAIEFAANTARSDFLYHGSLALRSAQSADALAALKAQHHGTIFIDVNLRAPWWNEDQIRALINAAHWAKLNQHELSILQGGAEPSHDLAQQFVRDYSLDGLILTHGSAGAEVITAEGERARITPQPSNQVVDTVGAGDAFASVMILGLLRDWPLPIALERAQGFASETVRHQGALLRDRAIYQTFLQQWEPSTD